MIHKGNEIIWKNGNTNKSWRLEKARMEDDLNAIRTEAQNYKKYFFKKGIQYVGVGYNW